MEKYYTVDQIAELLTLHPKTIQRYIREGKIIAKKVDFLYYMVYNTY